MSTNTNVYTKLIGLTITEIVRDDDYNEKLYFHFDNGLALAMYHEQDCCESVTIEDIDGDLNDLIGSPLTMAEETVRTGTEDDSDCDESCTWTFYKFATVNGYVTIRWFGSSNGYYSESVDFVDTDYFKRRNLDLLKKKM